MARVSASLPWLFPILEGAYPGKEGEGEGEGRGGRRGRRGREF